MESQLRVYHLFKKTVEIMLSGIFIWQNEQDSKIYKICFTIPFSFWLMTSAKLINGCFHVKSSSALAKSAVSAVAFPSTIAKV